MATVMKCLNALMDHMVLSVTPSSEPSAVPSESPSVAPTTVPSMVPYIFNTNFPSWTPTFEPSGVPLIINTFKPTLAPSYSLNFVYVDNIGLLGVSIKTDIEGSEFGKYVDTIGDINGDGFEDFFIIVLKLKCGYFERSYSE